MTSEYRWLAHYEPGVAHSVDVPNTTVHQLLAGLNGEVSRPDRSSDGAPLFAPGAEGAGEAELRELNRLSDRFAAALVNLGVSKGSRVSIMLPNIPQMVIAYFGVLKAGAIVVNTNPTYPAHELEPLLRSAGAETIVTLSGLYDRVLRNPAQDRHQDHHPHRHPRNHRQALPQHRGQTGARQRHDESRDAAERAPIS